MYHKILGSLLLFSMSFLFAGSITATVDRSEVIKGDSVLLTLTMTGKKIDYIPEIEEIGGQKVINIQRRSASNFVHINGVSSMEKTQTLTLEFRPDSNMTIPAFSVNVDGKLETANEIKLTVVNSATGTKRETKNFSLDLEMSKSKLYLGESAILTVYFKQRTNVDVVQIDYVPPQLKDFFSKQMGDGKTYRKGIFTIQELNYLVIPKVAGKLMLEPARAKVAQRSRQKQQGGWYTNVAKWTQLASPSLIVQVIAPTQKHDIVGEYRLSTHLDYATVKANKPVRLKVELLGKGSLDDYEGIKFHIPHVTMYADDAKIKSTLLGKVLQSRYEKSFVFIANHDFTIPSKEIRVYDYKSGKVKVLKTKSYEIKVEGGTTVESKPIVYTKRPILLDKNEKLNRPWVQTLPSLLALFFAFALGVTVTLAFKYIPSLSFLKQNQKPFNGNDALKVLFPKMSESLEVEEIVRKLYALQNGEKNIKIDKKRLKELVEYYK